MGEDRKDGPTSVEVAGIRLDMAAGSDRGRERVDNQDRTGLFERDLGSGKKVVMAIVADGMGGEKFGAEAADAAVKLIRERFEELGTSLLESKEKMEEWMRNAVMAADIEVSEVTGHKGGATIVAAVVWGEQVWVVNAGDSRAYVVGRNNKDKLKIEQISQDHRMVNLLEKQGLSEEAAKVKLGRPGALYMALGKSMLDKEELGSNSGEMLKSGRALLLCSDGLWEMVEDGVIAETVDGAESADEVVRKLTDRANKNGGLDNISVVVVRMVAK